MKIANETRQSIDEKRFNDWTYKFKAIQCKSIACGHDNLWVRNETEKWTSVLMKFELIFSLFIGSNTFEHWFELIFRACLYITCCVRQHCRTDRTNAVQMVSVFLIYLLFYYFTKWGEKELGEPSRQHCRITVYCLSRIFAVAWLGFVWLLRLELFTTKAHDRFCVYVQMSISDNIILACDVPELSAATPCSSSNVGEFFIHARICITVCALASKCLGVCGVGHVQTCCLH